MMGPQQDLGTLVQTWRKTHLLTWTTLLILIHIFGFFLGLIWAPALYYSSQYPAKLCRNNSSSGSGKCQRPLESGEYEKLSSLGVAFTFPDAAVTQLGDKDSPSTLSPWNWRILASLMIDITIDIQKDVDNIVKENYEAFKGLHSQSLDFVLNAHLDSNDGEDWIRDYDFLEENRTLDCTRSYHLAKNNESQDNLEYICTLTPFMDLQVVHNKSYRLTFEIMSSNETVLNTPGRIRSYLTTIVENSKYHNVLFYVKCLFTPGVLLALAWFGTKIHTNDLYITIPDRLLISCGVLQFIQNIPVEILVDQWSIPHVKLLNDAAYIGLISCLYLYWIIYTKDKLARNEPWERNTRYYWRQILAVVVILALFILKTMYSRMPGFKNPFNNHWSYEKVINISLGFIFSLAILLMTLQTYLSVLIFRVLCDISISYPSVPKAWRIKMIILYCFTVSLLTSGGFLLNLALELSLYLNSHFHFEPLPFHMSFASAYLLGLEVLWNLHIVALLVMLSRKSNIYQTDGGCIYVKPVRYDQVGTGDDDDDDDDLDYIDDDDDLSENKEVIHMLDLKSPASETARTTILEFHDDEPSSDSHRIPNGN